MTLSPALRPVLAILGAASALSACAMPEGGFEAMAQRVAAIDVPLEPGGPAPASAPRAAPQPARDPNLRQAFAPLRVELVEPEGLWAARDGALPALAAAAAPVVVDAAVREIEKTAAPTLAPALRPALKRAAQSGRMVQLGAFSSEQAARAAWRRLSGDDALAGLTPRFEPAEVNGRALVRLKAGPVRPDAAAAVCRAARIDDPWCRQA